VSEKTFPVPLRSTVEGMQWLYNTATDNFIRELRDANAELDALRAEVERLRERLDRIDAFAGERCEASGCRHDPCGPVEYHDVEGVPLCAECWHECLDEAAEEEGK
jgi:hypothetical protein